LSFFIQKFILFLLIYKMGGGGSKIILANDLNYNQSLFNATPDKCKYTTAHCDNFVNYKKKEEIIKDDDIIQLITIFIFLLLFFTFKYI
jgi:hypothetical protein